MIVVDASVLVEVLFRGPRAPLLEARLSMPQATLHAPHLIDVEVAQVTRRFLLRGEITADHGRKVLTGLADLPIIRYPHGHLLPRMWELRHNMTAYDAAYVALAELLAAPLLTCDARLANAPGHQIRVELV